MLDPYAKFWFVKKFIQTPYKAPHEAVGFTSASAQASKASRDAVSALINLGYRRLQAVMAVRKAAEILGADAPVAALIRHALADLGTVNSKGKHTA